MIKAITGNLLKSIKAFNLDGIMSAANGTGPMGRGIAGAIKHAGGQEIQTDAFRVCKELDPKPGGAYSTIAGSLQEQGIKCIIHAVTMKKPAGLTSYDDVRHAFEAAISLAKLKGIKEFGCTALGTGVGGLDPRVVADDMFSVAKFISDMDIIFIDFDDTFISRINYLLSDDDD